MTLSVATLCTAQYPFQGPSGLRTIRSWRRGYQGIRSKVYQEGTMARLQNLLLLVLLVTSTIFQITNPGNHPFEPDLRTFFKRCHQFSKIYQILENF